MAWSAEGRREWEQGLEKLKPAMRSRLVKLCERHNPPASLDAEGANLDSLREYLGWQDAGWTKRLEAEIGL